MCKAVDHGANQHLQDCESCLFKSKISSKCIEEGAGLKCRDCVANESTQYAHSQQSGAKAEVDEILHDMESDPIFIATLNAKNPQYVKNIADISVVAAALLDADTLPVVTPFNSGDGLVHIALSRCIDDEGEINVLITSRNPEGSPNDVEIQVALDPFTTNKITMNGRVSVSRTVVRSLISRTILITMRCLFAIWFMS